MKKMLFITLLCVLTFGCEEVSNDLRLAASELKTVASDLVGELNDALNGGEQDEPSGSAENTPHPVTETVQTNHNKDHPVASQPAKTPEMFTGEIVKKRFTEASKVFMRQESFRIVVRSNDGRIILFDLRGSGAESMDFIYDLHDSIILPLDAEALKKKFNLHRVKFMDVDIQLHQPITTQPAAQPIPVPEQAEPAPAKPPVEEKPKEFGTLFDEEPQS